ncbi:hypothetical protein JCM8547_005618 [Rhodosporidiobolus lusitaniae]
MSPLLPQYSSLPSSSTADIPLAPQTARHRTSLDASDAEEHSSSSSNDEKLERGLRADETEEEGMTDAEGGTREGLLSGRRKGEGQVEGEDEDDGETLADALRVERKRKDWLARIKPRTILLSFLFVTVLLLLLFLFHPSSPYVSSSRSSGLYSSHGYVSPNPLGSDSKYGDVPFAKVGASWEGNGKTPTWAGGDNGEKELESKLTGGGGRRWNGTHWWDPTVILISLDGVRADYLERGLTPHLLNISRRGLRADYLQPAFPSLTFPNHWSILTGLHPSSHGIVANDFWDPSTQKEFNYQEPARSWSASWWGGEPIWATVVKSALRSAVLMWPGPPVLADGTKPTLWYPFVDHYHFRKKVDRVSKWLDTPYSHRPHLMTVYLPDVDQAGHKAGPHSKTVEKALGGLDEFVRQVMEQVDARNLTEVVDVVVVSDHGMAETSNDRLIFLDDILGADGFASIERNEGWPSAGLRFKPGTNEQAMLAKLKAAGATGKGDGSGFECYETKGGEDMPERWHFTGNERIAPIYCIPHLGWAFTNHHELEVVMQNNYVVKGNHGYDPSLPDMRGIFVAHGPFASRLKLTASRQRRRRALVAREPIPSDPATTVIPGFANLEVYDLVANLLRIPHEQRAKTNGTEGFWEGYLEDDEGEDEGAGA